MSIFDSPKYDEPKRWIQIKRQQNISWDILLLAKKDNNEQLTVFLSNQAEDNNWPKLSVEEWQELVKETKEYEERQLTVIMNAANAALYDRNQDNNLKIPENERSCWQLYKHSLGWDNESIEILEKTTHGILRRLNIDTRNTKPIKGLVVGHVQSGKTANMEALMAMAADHGWNMFIVLSGTIESLRLQTLRRMQHDLNQPGNINWVGVEHPSRNSPYGQRARDFNLTELSSQRYFTVCLKNASRLKKLIDWIQSDRASHEQMKILVIDDEADQASVANTTVSDEDLRERRGINKLIVNLVDDVKHRDGTSNGHCRAMNYIMYTATPYANFLNEATPKSLYPKDFIWTLSPSKEYIGPNQIFGFPDDNEKQGLDIKRIVSDEDLDIVKSIYDGDISDLPASLKDAVCWFLCAAAVMRKNGYKKPISMLVHTSQKQLHHENIANAISEWFKDNRSNNVILDRCKEVYSIETEKPSKEEWFQQFSEYGRQKDDVPDYPSFEEILEEINILLGRAMSFIRMNEEGDLVYHEGVHLVIDNCARTGAVLGDDYVRLAYPDPESDNYPSPAPAFVIVGGSTLSRGLTIEGLVSTFFLRASCQADTLMQMGRWFGYRKNYELLPRIWMTSDTTEKFRFLSLLESDLRDDLKKYIATDVRPDEYGPRILCSPKLNWLRLTSRRHMQSAVSSEMDFSGAKPQTTIFDNDKIKLEKNLEIASKFINSLPDTVKLSNGGNCIFWENIDLESILQGLLVKDFTFSSRSRVFNEIQVFVDWIKKLDNPAAFKNWTVIAAGKNDAKQGHSSDDKRWNIHGWNIGKVNRAKLKNDDDKTVFNIRILRALTDTVADIDSSIIDEYTRLHGNISKQDDANAIRKLAGKSNIPLLLIYCIDKDSVGNDDQREDLKSPCDIIGIQMIVPGDPYNKSFVKKLTIRLPDKNKEEKVENL